MKKSEYSAKGLAIGLSIGVAISINLYRFRYIKV